jgi:type VI secretion system secreted protein Hcp
VSRHLRLLVPLLVVLAVGAGYALAARDKGRGDDQIRACVDKAGPGKGRLRIADKCRKGERRLAWAKRGPTGPAGAPGPPGSPGPSASGGAAPCQPSPSSGDGFLDLSGVPGGSTRDGHEGEIEVSGFCLAGSAGSFGDLAVRTVPGPHSAPVLSRLLSNATIASGRLSARHTVEGQTSDFFVYDLSGLQVDGYRLLGEEEEVRLCWNSATASYDGHPAVALTNPGRTPRASLLGCPATANPVDAFVDWPGLPGESERDGHEGEIEAPRVCLDARRAYDGAAAPSFTAVVGTGTDLASAGLLARAGTGAVEPGTVRITLRRTVEGQTSDFVGIQMQGTRVAAAEQRSSTGDAVLFATLSASAVSGQIVGTGF